MRRGLVVAVYAFLVLVSAGLGAYLAVAWLVERTPEVEVPDLRGLALGEALDRLQGTGLDLEVRDFDYSDTVPENHVLLQHPRPGARVKAGRGVGVILSRGPERHPAPDLRGLSLEDARIRLEELGLKARVEARVHRGPEGRVVGQGVAPGQTLPRGAEVPLAVSRGPRPILWRMPRVAGLPLAEALDRIDRLGLRVGRIEEVEILDPAQAGRVVAQDPLPGFPAEEGRLVSLTVAGTAPALGAARAVYLFHRIPPGFGKARVQVVWRAAGRAWTVRDEWVPRGAAVRAAVPAGLADRVELWVDGRPVQTATPAELGL
ncbi:PASTA domain-containing protein [Deferrisoma sp.]